MEGEEKGKEVQENKVTEVTDQTTATVKTTTAESTTETRSLGDSTAANGGKGAKAKAKAKAKRSPSNIIAMVVAVILILLIIPLAGITIVLSVKSAMDPDNPPSIFGYAPLTVASGSMSGSYEDSFDEGDLIFIKVLDDEEKNSLQVNDVICFTTDGMFVTHRIISIEEDGGVITSLTTMGDANKSADDPITTDVIYGIYTGKIKNLGAFAEFLQTPAGIAVFIAVPVMAFIIYDVAMIILKKKKSEELSKDEEIARLKKMLDEKGSAEEDAGKDDNV